MAGPLKADLLKEARDRGLDVPKKTTKAELIRLLGGESSASPRATKSGLYRHNGKGRCRRCGRINPHVHGS